MSPVKKVTFSCLSCVFRNLVVLISIPNSRSPQPGVIPNDRGRAGSREKLVRVQGLHFRARRIKTGLASTKGPLARTNTNSLLYKI